MTRTGRARRRPGGRRVACGPVACVLAACRGRLVGVDHHVGRRPPRAVVIGARSTTTAHRRHDHDAAGGTTTTAPPDRSGAPRRPHRLGGREQRGGGHDRDHGGPEEHGDGPVRRWPAIPASRCCSASGSSLPTRSCAGAATASRPWPRPACSWPRGSPRLQHRVLRRAGGQRDQLPDLGIDRGDAAQRLDHLVMTAALAPCGGGTLVVSPVFAADRREQPDHGPAGH